MSREAGPRGLELLIFIGRHGQGGGGASKDGKSSNGGREGEDFWPGHKVIGRSGRFMYDDAEEKIR